MKLIKLSATNSTNSFLKDLAHNSTLENFTVVIADDQVNGRGQQENVWHSEPHKNLTFSTYVNFKALKINHQKYLNFAVSLAIYETLLIYKVPQLSIKWPNDIMSANKKLCGILVENVIKRTNIDYSIIGIGLNVNQEYFPNYLPNATSVKNCISKEIPLDVLLTELILKLKQKIELLNAIDHDTLEQDYLNVLYKKNIPTAFKDNQNVLFMGIIKGISSNGNLQILLKDDSIKEFGIKEVSFA